MANFDFETEDEEIHKYLMSGWERHVFTFDVTLLRNSVRVLETSDPYSQGSDLSGRWVVSVRGVRKNYRTFKLNFFTELITCPRRKVVFFKAWFHLRGSRGREILKLGQKSSCRIGRTVQYGARDIKNGVKEMVLRVSIISETADRCSLVDLMSEVDLRKYPSYVSFQDVTSSSPPARSASSEATATGSAEAVSAEDGSRRSSEQLINDCQTVWEKNMFIFGIIFTESSVCIVPKLTSLETKRFRWRVNGSPKLAGNNFSLHIWANLLNSPRKVVFVKVIIMLYSREGKTVTSFEQKCCVRAGSTYGRVLKDIQHKFQDMTLKVIIISDTREECGSIDMLTSIHEDQNQCNDGDCLDDDEVEIIDEVSGNSVGTDNGTMSSSVSCGVKIKQEKEDEVIPSVSDRNTTLQITRVPGDESMPKRIVSEVTASSSSICSVQIKQENEETVSGVSDSNARLQVTTVPSDGSMPKRVVCEGADSSFSVCSMQIKQEKNDDDVVSVPQQNELGDGHSQEQDCDNEGPELHDEVTIIENNKSTSEQTVNEVTCGSSAPCNAQIKQEKSSEVLPNTHSEGQLKCISIPDDKLGSLLDIKSLVTLDKNMVSTWEKCIYTFRINSEEDHSFTAQCQNFLHVPNEISNRWDITVDICDSGEERKGNVYIMAALRSSNMNKILAKFSFKFYSKDSIIESFKNKCCYQLQESRVHGLKDISLSSLPAVLEVTIYSETGKKLDLPLFEPSPKNCRHTTDCSSGEVKVVFETRGINMEINASILLSCSDVFRNIIESDGSESKDIKITLNEFDPINVCRMLKFVSHKSDLNLNLESAAELLQMSHKFGLVELKQECESFLMSQLNELNVMRLLILADSNSAAQLSDMAIDFICKNQENFKQDNQYDELNDRPILLKKILVRLVAFSTSETKRSSENTNQSSKQKRRSLLIDQNDGCPSSSKRSKRRDSL